MDSLVDKPRVVVTHSITGAALEPLTWKRGRDPSGGAGVPDVIDANVLAPAGEVFTLTPALPAAAVAASGGTRRGKRVVDGNRSRRSLISLARRAVPDV